MRMMIVMTDIPNQVEMAPRPQPVLSYSDATRDRDAKYDSLLRGTYILALLPMTVGLLILGGYAVTRWEGLPIAGLFWQPPRLSRMK